MMVEVHATLKNDSFILKQRTILQKLPLLQ